MNKNRIRLLKLKYESEKCATQLKPWRHNQMQKDKPQDEDRTQLPDRIRII